MAKQTAFTRSNDTAQAQVSKVFNMKLETWISPGTLEFTLDPLRGIQFLLRFQRLHESEKRTWVTWIPTETFSKHPFRLNSAARP